jgi:hypothetical protein
MRISGPSRRLRLRVARVSPPMSPSRPRAFHPAWWALVGWSARALVGHGSTVQQPAAGTRSGGSGDEYSGRRSRRWRRPWVGGIGGAIAYLPVFRAGARADIVVAVDVPRPPVSLVQHQALSALQPAATANGPTPATRVRVVLLPHPRTEPTDIRANLTPGLRQRHDLRAAEEVEREIPSR